MKRLGYINDGNLLPIHGRRINGGGFELMKKLLFVLFQIFILIWNPAASNAYFRVQSSNDMDLIKMEKALRSPKPWSNTFAVYDDLFVEQSGKRQAHVLYPFREEYLGFDKIYIGMPFFNVARISFSNEFTLESLLYANLKLKMLIDENEAQKKQISQLLQKMKVSFLDTQTISRNSISPDKPESMRQTIENSQYETLHITLQDQRRRYIPLYKERRHTRAVNSQDVTEKKGNDYLKYDALSSTQEQPSIRKSQGSEDVADDTQQEGYSVNVAQKQKPLGLLANILIWVVKIINYATKDPLMLIFLLMVFFLGITFLKVSISNMKK